MGRRSSRFAICLTALASGPALSAAAAAPAAPPPFFMVCGSAPAFPTVYFSGVVQTQPASAQQVRNDFTAYLTQQYAYKGPVGCVPANSLVNAQKVITTQGTVLRNAKKNVVETGWSEGGASVMARIGAALAPAAAAVPAATAAAAPSVKATTPGRATAPGSAAGTPASATAGGSSGSDLASTLGSIFGTSACSGSAGGAGAKGGAGKGGGGASGDAAGGSGGCQSPYSQVSGTLTTLFGNSGGGGGTNAKASRDGVHPGAVAADPQQGLGSAEAQSTKLVVYGCGRHDTQVACVTDLTNENQKESLVVSDVWKDAFIVDDRGDRHPRSKGVFLNIDGEQRSQLDIGYGKTARFVLMFDDVPAKVQTVTLRSAGGVLDVEDISLAAAGGGAGASQAR
ncbi:MAG: hypothetical protein JSS29_00095 [Proteobacteria bacterium]|nr:hypothetical protein [Pseudomonadota bacterium]